MTGTVSGTSHRRRFISAGRSLRLMAGGSLLALLLMLAGVTLGRALYQPPILAADLEETPDCVLPCWQSLRPGEVSAPVANQVILAMGYLRRERPFAGPVEYTPSSPAHCELQLIVIDNTVDRIRLFHCPPIRLGDLIPILGYPDGVIADRFAIVFRGGRVTALAQRIECEQRYTPETFIGTIDFLSDPRRPTAVYPWQGFVDLDRYMPRSRIDLQC